MGGLIICWGAGTMPCVQYERAVTLRDAVPVEIDTSQKYAVRPVERRFDCRPGRLTAFRMERSVKRWTARRIA
jgi:hypothetical protein